MTRARAQHTLGRTRDAVPDVERALGLARTVGDPILLLQAITTALAVEGSDTLATEAYALVARITDALPDDTMRRRFQESELVQQVRG